jgi:hypothetical protein
VRPAALSNPSSQAVQMTQLFPIKPSHRQYSVMPITAYKEKLSS